MRKEFETILDTLTHEEFKPLLKRTMRQIGERMRAVALKQKPEKYYQNKREDFIALIDKGILEGWFHMPKSTSRIFRVYADKWD